MREHSGLATACTGQYQQRSLTVSDSLSLRLVQPFQQLPKVLSMGVGGHLSSIDASSEGEMVGERHVENDVNKGCITRDTVDGVANVSIRDLRNHGGDVVERAARGEQITITSSGKPVAELRALARPPMSTKALIARHRLLPAVDADRLRADIDELIDQRL
jgi:antitoxin (DNA-binding transcriptional repressor) of toxin-antitoxin stability system